MHVRSPARMPIVPWCLLALVVVSTTSDTPLAGQKQSQPHTFAEVAQAWVGLSKDELYVLRLDLRSDGTGVGSYVFANDAPVVFGVASWHLSAPKIELCSSATEGMHSLGTCLAGTVLDNAMTLTAKGTGWTVRFSLRKERELEGKWAQLRDAMTRRP